MASCKKKKSFTEILKIDINLSEILIAYNDISVIFVGVGSSMLQKNPNTNGACEVTWLVSKLNPQPI